MARPFLFGGNQPTNQMKYLVEFRAGKMQYQNKMVSPNKKKGLIFLNQSDDNLMHFCWKDRTTGVVEDDLIIFPEDAEFKRVAQCKTGRVYVLKFKNSERRCFYWMQEPSEEKDEEFCKKINEYLNNPPAPGSRTGSGLNMGNLADFGGLDSHDLQNLFSNVNPQQLMQLMSNIGGINSPGMLANLLNQPGSSRSSAHSASSQSTTTAVSGSSSSQATSSASNSTATNNGTNSSTGNNSSSSTAGATPRGIQLSDLQNIITGLSDSSGKTGASKEDISECLTQAVNSDALKSLLENKDFMSKVKEHLPSTDEDANSKSTESSETSNGNSSDLPKQVSSTIQSPQFRSALRTFTQAFQLGDLSPVIEQFNLGSKCVEAAKNQDLEAFIKAMEDTAKEKTAEKEETEMALD